ncbi:hypothetical protein [Herpetosiphon llansteffanensis]|uniref:hypothetical protein n=1 Tax=Herpetosiphon llansteffanensis TaxID=2094568 RepID=UPI000D7C9A36|nr:hypothetical protein [Herpetosiphon llansteffanensis]
MPMIDPIAAILKLFSDNTNVREIVGDRVAGKHKFAQAGSPNAWKADQSCIVAKDDLGSVPDIDIGDHVGRVELRCYGATPAAARKVYNTLIELMRAIPGRTTANTSNGTALIYSLVMDASPFTTVDPDLSIDMVVGYARYRIHEYALEEYQ